jgi:hypothetical protein
MVIGASSRKGRIKEAPEALKYKVVLGSGQPEAADQLLLRFIFLGTLIS